MYKYVFWKEKNVFIFCFFDEPKLCFEKIISKFA